MVNRVLLTTRSLIRDYPANKAITWIKQCRTDKVFSEMLSFRMLWSTVCRESIRYTKCPWFGLPGRWTPLHTPRFLAVQYSCYLCSHPSAQFVWLKDPGRRLERDSGAAPWEWGTYPAMTKVGWDSLGLRDPSIFRELTGTKWTVGSVR